MSATTTELEIPIATMRYDITMPLFEGRVEIPGVRLTPTRMSSMVFGPYPELQNGDFGLCDLNLGYFPPAVDAGWELVGLPVFSKRKPTYQFVFCRTNAGIERPSDLRGKRIGSRSYRTALTVWGRGLLQEHHGLPWRETTWVVWTKEVFPVHAPDARIEAPSDPQKSVVDALLDGEVDAILTDISDTQLMATLEHDERVRRLFPDYAGEDARLYRETGIYTPVHLMVMSRKLDQEHPGLARTLYDAFERAKQIAYDDITSDRGGFSVVYLRERWLEQQAQWGDPWQYGMAANRRTMDTFLAYNVDQGMISKPLTNEDLFAASTLDT
jgi:4,5-dihydroxyphthalate decarboxylase